MATGSYLTAVKEEEVDDSWDHNAFYASLGAKTPAEINENPFCKTWKSLSLYWSRNWKRMNGETSIGLCSCPARTQRHEGKPSNFNSCHIMPTSSSTLNLPKHKLCTGISPTTDRYLTLASSIGGQSSTRRVSIPLPLNVRGVV